MKKITFIALIFVLIISFAYYANTNIGIFETSPVMYVDLSITGDFENPVFDMGNTSRTIEMVPILKQNKNPGVPNENVIICDAFYDQQKINLNSVIVPYHGPGNYSLTFTFRDYVRLPTSDQESISVQLMFFSENKVFATEYLGFRWVNSTELQ